MSTPRQSYPKDTATASTGGSSDPLSTFKDPLDYPLTGYDQSSLDRSLRLSSPPTALGLYTPDMNLGTLNNDETRQAGHGDQSFNTGINSPSTLGIHSAQGATHGYARQLSTDEVHVPALLGGNDGIATRDQEIFAGQAYHHPSTAIARNAAIYYSSSTTIWTHAVPLEPSGAEYRSESDVHVENSSNDFPLHPYRANKFPETPPLISAYSSLDKSIDTISPGQSGVSSIAQMTETSVEHHSDAQPTTADAAYLSSCSGTPLRAVAVSAVQYAPSPARTKLDQSTYSFDALEYHQEQAPALVPNSLTRRGKRKMTSDKYGDGSKIYIQKRNDTDGTTEPFEAITDEAFPFGGCYVLAPTSPDGKKYPPGISPKRRNSKQKPQRKPMGMEDRAAVKQNRITGVCVRCKMFKEKCRGGFPCQRCCELKIWKTICVTSQLVEKHVFSKGLYRARASQLCRNVIQNWKDEATAPARFIEASNGYAPVLSLEVHEFQPKNQKMLDHIIWQDTANSTHARLPSTPYGLKGELSRLHRCDDYIDALVPDLVQEMDQCVGQNLYAQTMKAAYEYSKKNISSLLQISFRIWAIQMIFNRRWRISPTSGDNLGMSAITDNSSRLFGITPLPRVLEQQLDSILECRAAELEQDLLAEVQNMIFRRHPGEWFTTFLTMFVFLSALEKDTWNLETWNLEVMKGYLQVLEDEDVPIWPIYDTPPSFFIEKNVALVDVVAAHFRSVTRGNIPFTLNWRSDLVKQMAADPDAASYMQTVGEQISKSSTFLRARRQANYCREDENSLLLKFSSRLLITEDEENDYPSVG